MASAKTGSRKKAAVDASDEAAGEKPRMRKIIIKNFRCIGAQPVVVELDDIVVLVGKNNAGKSTILRACEVVMHAGSKEGELKMDDFPEGKIQKDRLPEIILETVVGDNKAPGEKWIHPQDKYIRERFAWESPGAPKRVGFNFQINEWDPDSVPWGAANVAKGKRPKPTRVESFASPEDQASKIVGLLAAELINRLDEIKGHGDEESSGLSVYRTLMRSLVDLQRSLMDASNEHVQRIQQSITQTISNVFRGYQVQFHAHHDEDKFASLVKAGVQLRMGPENGYMAEIERQGSGARRTLLWAALKLLAESKGKNESEAAKPFILLMDEPELCLHPNAIREARDVLYELAAGEQWQVMITTHSPVFIDLARNNTTVIRVEHDGKEVKGTTLFRSERALLSLDERMALKLLNHCDPHFAEFFFGGRTIIVEGDTEYTAFRFLLQDDEFKKRYPDLHIVNARGKERIAALCKILNQFRVPYSVLHDSDHPRKGSAWSANERIRDEMDKAASGVSVRRLALLRNFEDFCWGTTDSKIGEGDDKPYAAVKRLQLDQAAKARVERLLAVLCDHGDNVLPERAMEWRWLAELQQALGNQPPPPQTSLFEE